MDRSSYGRVWLSFLGFPKSKAIFVEGHQCVAGQEARGTFMGQHGKLQMKSSALQVSPEPMAPPQPLPAQMGPQRPQVTERECTPRQRLMPFKQTQSEKDRESQYLSEQAKQAGSPRNVREGEASAQRTLFQQTDIWRPSLSWGWGKGWPSNSGPTGKWMGPGQVARGWQKS